MIHHEIIYDSVVKKTTSPHCLTYEG